MSKSPHTFKPSFYTTNYRSKTIKVGLPQYKDCLLQSKLKAHKISSINIKTLYWLFHEILHSSNLFQTTKQNSKRNEKQLINHKIISNEYIHQRYLIENSQANQTMPYVNLIIQPKRKKREEGTQYPISQYEHKINTLQQN